VCTAAQRCAVVSSAADEAECAAAGGAAVWYIERLSTGSVGVVRVVNGAGAEKRCLTNSGHGVLFSAGANIPASAAGDCTGRMPYTLGTVNQTCPKTVLALPCLGAADGDGGTGAAAQLWRLDASQKAHFGGAQLRSVAEGAAAGGHGACLTAVPPVPLVEVVSALRAVDAATGEAVGKAAQPTPTTLADGSMELNLTLPMKAGKTYTLVLASLTSRDVAAAADGGGGGSVVAAASALALRSSTLAGMAALRQSHAAWWSAFWAASSVDLGASRRALEGFWYGMQYMSGSQNRAGKQATGLWGPWIQSDEMNWSGDYTLDCASLLC
jgi:hypothetical protein